MLLIVEFKSFNCTFDFVNVIRKENNGSWTYCALYLHVKGVGFCRLLLGIRSALFFLLLLLLFLCSEAQIKRWKISINLKKSDIRVFKRAWMKKLKLGLRNKDRSRDKRYVSKIKRVELKYSCSFGDLEISYTCLHFRRCNEVRSPLSRAETFVKYFIYCI